jgi:hypothetical protein
MKPEWHQPRATRPEFELREDRAVIASLVVHSSFGTLATATAGTACWTLKRVGFFQQRVSVRACGSEESLGEFVNGTWAGGGTLVMSDGRRFNATTNWWNTKWQVEDESGRVLLRFDYGGVFRLHADVEIPPASRDLPELPLLLTLSWYLVVMHARDAAATAAIIG